jgi:hypothetical protein
VIDRGFTAVQTGRNRKISFAFPDELGVDTTATPLAVGPGLSVDDYVSIYGKSLPAGTFSLGEYGAAFNTGRNMYGVVVVPLPEASTTLFGVICMLGALASRRSSSVGRHVSTKHRLGQRAEAVKAS